ncbi:MAG: AAA family ATPase [Ardenticatenaceae bacterium]
MIHLIIGSTGAGKTTYALALAAERGAVRFAVDDWMNTLFFPDSPNELTFEWAMERVTRCEAQIWKIALEVLHAGKEVVLEVSMSTKALRQKQRGIAKQSGYEHQIYYIELDRETRRERVLKRNQEKGKTFSFEVTEEMFDFVEGMFEPPDSDELRECVIVRMTDQRQTK